MWLNILLFCSAQDMCGNKMRNDRQRDESRCAQVRTDLVDSGIYLCEPDVLALFSDNWDYQARLPVSLPPAPASG